MFKRFFILLFIGSFLFMPVTFAKQATEIELQSSKTEVEVGEDFQISVLIKNASTGGINIGNIKIPGMENFQQTGSSQSTQIEMINGATSAVTKNIITLVALRSGEFDLGPVDIGKGIKSNTLNIKVTKSQNKSFFGGNSAVAVHGNLNSGDKRQESYSGVIKNIVVGILLFTLAFILYKRQKNKELDIDEELVDEEGESGPNIVLPSIDDDKFFEKSKANLLAYIQKKYSIDTEVLTSKEIAKEITKKGVYNRKELVQALEICDQGNFAASKSGKDEVLRIVRRLR